MVGTMRVAVIAAACLLLILSGCRDTPDSLMKSQIRTINKLADAIENKQSKDEIDAIQAALAETRNKLNALPMSPTERLELFKRHSPEMSKAAMRLNKAALNRTADELKFVLPTMPSLPK